MAGRVYWAWVPEAEAFNPTVHNRLDERVLELSVEESEGGFATVRAVIKSPETGLLSRSQKWAHVSIEAADGTVVHLAKGRLTGFPISGGMRTVEIELICRPSDWDARLAAFAETLKVSPFYDHLFAWEVFDDPDEIIDGYAGMYACDRVSHAATLTHVLTGEKTVDLGAPIDGSVSVSFGETPKRRCVVRLSAEWEQKVWGVWLAGDQIEATFSDGYVSTLAPEALEASWWKAGDTIADNAVVQRAGLNRIYPANETAYPRSTDEIESLGVFFADANWDPNDVLKKLFVQFGIAYYEASLNISYQIDQPRKEAVEITVDSGLQDVIEGDADPIIIDIQLGDVQADLETPEWQPSTLYAVGAEVRYNGNNYTANVEHTSGTSFNADFFYRDPADGVWKQRWFREAFDNSPIGGLSGGSFFGTARGIDAIRRAIMSARAALAWSMRCVDVSFDVPVDRVLGLTTRDLATVHVPGLNGGSVTGKIKAINIRISGGSAEGGAYAYATVTIGCSAGSGVAETAGAGELLFNPSGETWDAIAFSDTSVQPQPQSLPSSPIQSITSDNEASDQIAEILSVAAADGNPVDALSDIPTTVNLTLIPLTGREPYEHSYTVNARWAGPKQIDLSL